MTKISAKVVAHSKNEFGQEACSMEVVMPRFILAEFNTHRMFSRNSASSRAIPFNKMVEMVKNNPFIPIAWQKDHKGMQGTEYLQPPFHEDTILLWLESKNSAVKHAQELYDYGITKQLANRLLEPFMWHKVLVTATEWENFFTLRCPQYEIDGKIYRSSKDAFNKIADIEHSCWSWTSIDWLKANKGQSEIHMMILAEAMWNAKNESTPKQLKAGEWHIPYGNDIDYHKMLDQTMPDEGYDADITKIKIATAMNARISYTLVGEEGKEANYKNDIKLHDRLLESGHMSPFEHCARAMSEEEYSYFYKSDGPNPENFHTGWCSNFRGFIQYRHLITNKK